MYIHGIYVVYCGISMDICSFLKPDFAACKCCWSLSMRTCVGDQECFISLTTMAIVPGEEAAHKRLTSSSSPPPTPWPSPPLLAGVLAEALVPSPCSYESSASASSLSSASSPTRRPCRRRRRRRRRRRCRRQHWQWRRRRWHLSWLCHV